MLFYCIFNEVLSRFGAHILVILREDHARLGFHCFGDGLHIDGSRDVASAPAYKNAYSLHSFLLKLLRVFSECADDSLLRKLGIELCRNIVRLQMVFALTSYAGKSYGFYELCRLYLTRTTLDAGKA